MATFEEMFGGNSGGRYLKWENEGDAFFLLVTSEPDVRHHQTNFKTKKKIFMVQDIEGGAWRKADEGSFNPDSVSRFFPLTQFAARVKVIGKETRMGKEANWTPFDTLWEMSQGQQDALKTTMLEERIPFSPGTVVKMTLLDKSTKPYAFSAKMKVAE